MTMSIFEFFSEIDERYDTSDNLRYGQIAFNYLSEVRPELAEKVRGTSKDPFYIEDIKHPNWKRFIDFIEKNWHSTFTNEETGLFSRDIEQSCYPSSSDDDHYVRDAENRRIAKCPNRDIAEYIVFALMKTYQ
jgi:hypothetical protein